jgi:hypothetical protein
MVTREEGLGFIECNAKIEFNTPLLMVVLHD